MGKNKHRDGREKKRGKPSKEKGKSKVSRMKKFFGGKKAEEPEEQFSIAGAMRRVSHLFAWPILHDEGPEETSAPRRGDERSTPQVPANDSHRYVWNNSSGTDTHLTPSVKRRLHSTEEYPSPLEEQEEIFDEYNFEREHPRGERQEAFPETQSEASWEEPAARSDYDIVSEDFPDFNMPGERLARLPRRARPPKKRLPTRSARLRSRSPVATESEEFLDMPGERLGRLPQRARPPKRRLPTRSARSRSKSPVAAIPAIRTDSATESESEDFPDMPGERLGRLPQRARPPKKRLPKRSRSPRRSQTPPKQRRPLRLPPRPDPQVFPTRTPEQRAAIDKENEAYFSRCTPQNWT